MGKELTKRKALEVCILMWDELAESGSSDKGTVSSVDVLWMESNCACCEYDSQNLGGCRSCPFPGWRAGLGGCLTRDSPYYKWSESSSSVGERKIFAKQIADLARKALAELK